jgi:hypothetical protein
MAVDGLAEDAGRYKGDSESIGIQRLVDWYVGLILPCRTCVSMLSVSP